MRKDFFAKARSDLLLRRVDEEGVVYDFGTHKAHCLNRTALCIFELANGTRSLRELAAATSEALGGTITAQGVALGLAALDAANLLETPLPTASQPSGGAKTATRPASRRLRSGFDRRKFLGTVAMGAVAIPAVWSILAPTPAYAQSVPCVQGAVCTPGSHACCGTPGQPAMACNGMGMCNSSASQCMGLICG